MGGDRFNQKPQVGDLADIPDLALLGRFWGASGPEQGAVSGIVKTNKNTGTGRRRSLSVSPKGSFHGWR
jgi:hypothetical protein